MGDTPSSGKRERERDVSKKNDENRNQCGSATPNCAIKPNRQEPGINRIIMVSSESELSQVCRETVCVTQNKNKKNREVVPWDRGKICQDKHRVPVTCEINVRMRLTTGWTVWCDYHII